MNYYEHHIGDYAEATMHLTFVEDAAYSRLIRKYYASEKPLPADLKQVQRLVGARTKEEKSAVQAVLEEFFSLQDDGWHQERCDRSIADYLDGEPERVIKKANEDTRMKRHREERAKLFSLLNEAGQHAPWNISMNDLRALVQRFCNVSTATPATETSNAPATAPATPATATQYPIPNTHTPIPIGINTITPAGVCPIEPSANLDPADLLGDTKPANGLPDCPYTRLLELWAKHLPHLTQPRVWEGNRKATMRQRWQQAAKPSAYSPKGYASESEGIAWWDSFFAYIAKDTSLSDGFTTNSRTWQPDLEWVCNAANFQKIIDGKYES